MPWYTTADARRDAEKQAAAKIDPLQNPGVQGLVQLGRNAIERTLSLERAIATLSSQLGSLLAVIHRDGGHYETEHGTEKAVTDAIQRIFDTRAGLVAADELAMLVRRLARALQKASPDSELPKKAMDYLSIAGLAGSPMRKESA